MPQELENTKDKYYTSLGVHTLPMCSYNCLGVHVSKAVSPIL